MNPFPPITASDIPGITVYRAPCQYQVNEFGDSFLPQWASDPVTEAVIEDTINTKPE
jgi:hypothetical protein